VKHGKAKKSSHRAEPVHDGSLALIGSGVSRPQNEACVKYVVRRTASRSTAASYRCSRSRGRSAPASRTVNGLSTPLPTRFRRSRHASTMRVDEDSFSCGRFDLFNGLFSPSCLRRKLRRERCFPPSPVLARRPFYWLQSSRQSPHWQP
jgi:hypothetical protein